MENRIRNKPFSKRFTLDFLPASIENGAFSVHVGHRGVVLCFPCLRAVGPLDSRGGFGQSMWRRDNALRNQVICVPEVIKLYLNILEGKTAA